jgi:hypothetical protein
MMPNLAQKIPLLRKGGLIGEAVARSLIGIQLDRPSWTRQSTGKDFLAIGLESRGMSDYP